jgi:hypothetical protein
MHNNCKNKDVVYITVASNNYTEHLERLLASLKLHSNNSLMIVYLVNVDVSKDDYFKELFPDTVLRHKYVEFSTIGQHRGFCSNLRSEVFLDVMNEFNTPIVWIDVDSILIKSDSELIEYAEKYDMSVDYTKNHPTLSLSKYRLKKYPTGPFGTPYYGVFNISTITTNNSKSAKNFFFNYALKIREHPTSWYADQEGLYLLYKEFKNKINFNILPDKYCSRINSNEAIIWTAKGNGKNDNDYVFTANSNIFKIRGWDMTTLPKEKFFNLGVNTERKKTGSLIYKILTRVSRAFLVLVRGDGRSL